MNIDCIILSNTANDFYYGITNQTIKTLVASEPNITFHIKLIESNTNSPYNFEFENIEIIKPNEPFNYNRFLNFGLDQCKNDWIILSNNDIIYTQNWLTYLLDEYNKNNEILSMSPYEPNWHKGYFPTALDINFGYHAKTYITGWCIVINKKVFETIGKFDEQFPFWYQDDDYGKTIEKHKIKHALVKKSIIYHLGSQSHVLLANRGGQHELTWLQKSVFDKKWNSGQ